MTEINPAAQKKVLLLSQNHNWIRLGKDGVPEFFCDHHMLSTFRLCEAKFVEEHIRKIQPRYGRGTSPHGTQVKHTAWFLEFGTWFHKMMEEYYHHVKNGTELSQAQWLAKAAFLWDAYDLDYYKERHKGFKNIGGLEGAIAMLSQYYYVYWGRERFRVIGTELAYGANKEVPILEDHTLYPYAPFRAYYTGRIDQLLDDNVNIGPMDHKTKSNFDGKEIDMFAPHEGMEGYVYSAGEILKKYFPNIHRPVNRVWINHISVKPDNDPFKRFRRLPVCFTPEQLADWRLRQIRTFSKLYQVIVGEIAPDWNTNVCNSIYHNPCPFKALHSIPASQMITLITANFEEREEWNPYNVED